MARNSLIFSTTVLLTVLCVTSCTTISGLVKTDKAWTYVNKLCARDTASFHYKLSFSQEHEGQRLLLYNENQWAGRAESCQVTEEALGNETTELIFLTNNASESGCSSDVDDNNKIVCNKTWSLPDATWYYVAIDNCNNQSQGIHLVYTMSTVGRDEQILDSCSSRSEDSTPDGNWSNGVRIGTGFALLVLVVGFIVFIVYKRNKSFKKQTRSHSRGTAYLSGPPKSYEISDPMPIIQPHSNDSTNTNMAFAVDSDDDTAVTTVASLHAEQQPNDTAYAVTTSAAFTTENPLFECPRVQSNSLIVQPDVIKVQNDGVQKEVDRPDTTTLVERVSIKDHDAFNTGHESFHQDPDNLTTNIQENKTNTTTADTKSIHEEIKDNQKIPTADIPPRRLSAPESTHPVSDVKREDEDDDDNVFYD